MRKLLFITTANLTTNPRLLKEVKAASPYNQCEVICFKLCNWSDTFEEGHIASLSNIKVHYISAGRKPFFLWLFSTLTERVAQRIYPVLQSNLFLTSIASNKRTWLLLNAVKHIKDKPDLIIAHNLGALYPAYRLAKELNTKFTFDIEDYHPGERINTDQENEKKRREYLLRKLLPDAAYLSYASPLIGLETLNLLKESYTKPHSYIANSFSQSEFIEPDTAKTDKLRLVWFSQNIAAGRGLEILIESLDGLDNQIELHLYGNLDKTYFEKNLNQQYIFIHTPLPQRELHLELAKYDIGLALEINEADFNRNICLTNKIYAYALAGLYILATNTQGQEWFLNEYPWSGELVGQDKESIRIKIQELICNTEEIRRNSKDRFRLAKMLSWEHEHNKLNLLWQEVVVSNENN
ncbi:hypothetical protein [Parabacteroides sp. FAFU027]|uniref:hypothetical protein n=1 Tax=Parabacteroides sp. FAFU027 TaxID=2922715 RepID=UPI001FAFBF46|nr:hypothetical protein [Parabacteroides sp. FAFU027]